MNFDEPLSDKTIKPKAKTELLSKWLLDNPKKSGELINYAKKAKDPIKATCIEALEYVTKTHPKIANKICFDFVNDSLKEKAPRIKWESARVIGNTVALFPKEVGAAVKNLLVNAEHPGTVVRWSVAFALGEIIKLNLPINKTLVPAAQNICAQEEKNSIKKIYLAAIKKVNSSQ